MCCEIIRKIELSAWFGYSQSLPTWAFGQLGDLGFQSGLAIGGLLGSRVNPLITRYFLLALKYFIAY